MFPSTPGAGPRESAKVASFESAADTEHQQVHALMEKRKIAHVYRDGPARKHDWHSGWVAEAVELLVGKRGE
jgi:hypothetical protein